jgi:hypothetical protein
MNKGKHSELFLTFYLIIVIVNRIRQSTILSDREDDLPCYLYFSNKFYLKETKKGN